MAYDKRKGYGIITTFKDGIRYLWHEIHLKKSGACDALLRDFGEYPIIQRCSSRASKLKAIKRTWSVEIVNVLLSEVTP